MTPMEPGLRIAGTVEFAGLVSPPSETRALLLKRDALAGLDALDARTFTTWMGHRPCLPDSLPVLGPVKERPGLWRSEEHTSELQSLMRISYAVFCLKKKK